MVPDACHHAWLSVGTGDPNLGLYACMAGSLSTKLSPQSQIIPFEWNRKLTAFKILCKYLYTLLINIYIEFSNFDAGVLVHLVNLGLITWNLNVFDCYPAKLLLV